MRRRACEQLLEGLLGRGLLEQVEVVDQQQYTLRRGVLDRGRGLVDCRPSVLDAAHDGRERRADGGEEAFGVCLAGFGAVVGEGATGPGRELREQGRLARSRRRYDEPKAAFPELRKQRKQPLAGKSSRVDKLWIPTGEVSAGAASGDREDLFV